jgi:YVTN family beta-propeller protein
MKRRRVVEWLGWVGALLAPVGVAWGSPNGWVVVTSDRSEDLVFIDPDRDEVVNVVDVSRRPTRVVGGLDPAGDRPGRAAEPATALRPDGEVIYVARAEEDVVDVLDAGSLARIDRVEVGGGPRQVVFSADGARAYVPCARGGVVSVVDARTHRALAEIPIGGADVQPSGAALAPDGRTLFVTNGGAGSVSVVDLGANAVVATVEGVGARPRGIGVTPDGRKLYTANGASDDVAVIDVAAHRVIRRIRVGAAPARIAVTDRAPELASGSPSAALPLTVLQRRPRSFPQLSHERER